MQALVQPSALPSETVPLQKPKLTAGKRMLTCGDRARLHEQRGHSMLPQEEPESFPTESKSMFYKNKDLERFSWRTSHYRSHLGNCHTATQSESSPSKTIGSFLKVWWLFVTRNSTRNGEPTSTASNLNQLSDSRLTRNMALQMLFLLYLQHPTVVGGPLVQLELRAWCREG